MSTWARCSQGRSLLLHGLLAVCLLWVSGRVLSQSAQAPLGPEAALLASEPELEARLMRLSEELRCLVCQNESLASSHAELADDLRREVRGLLRSGKTDAQVKAFLVDRYGDFVLYRPEVKPLTWLLWFGPFALLVLALWLLVNHLRQRPLVPAAPLTPQQQARLNDLMKD